MSEFGHAIGAPSQHEQVPSYGSSQPYGQSHPYGLEPQYGQRPSEPPNVQDELANLAAAHAQARQRAESGDLTGARTLIEEALASGELQFGREDPRLAPLMVDLATIARRLGNLTEARNQLRRAYAIIVASAGPEHATSLSIEGRLAAVVYRLGEPTEAYDWHLADAGQRVLGADHPAVRGAQQRLAASPQGQPPIVVPPPFSAPEPAAAPAWNAGSQAWATDTQGWVSDAQSWSPELVPTTPPVTATYAPVADGVYRRQPDVPVTMSPPLAQVQDDVQVWPEPPLAAGDLTVRQRRGHGGGVALVASLGVVILVAAIVVALQLLHPDGGPVAPPPVSQQTAITVPANPAPTAAMTSTTAAPGRVLIKDDGGSVTLTWDDPGAGKVPFIVSGGRDGNALLALASVPAGQTTSTIYGLNVNFNYCFTVAAVWSSDNIQSSIRTCTYRLSTSGAS